MKKILHQLYSLFSSLKLTLFILITAALTAVPATILPQNQPAQFYLSSLPPFLRKAVLLLGIDSFFRSPIFLFLVLLFWLNLFFCTLRRFKKSRRSPLYRIGPDILHTGLLILVIGGILSFSTRQEAFVFLSRGDVLQLTGTQFIVLKDFRFETYSDGRPRRWTSRVTLAEQDETGEPGKFSLREGEPLEITVNHPLRTGGLSIYQSSYRPSSVPGTWDTGLTITRDPGKPVILSALIILVPGLMLTLFQKRNKL